MAHFLLSTHLAPKAGVRGRLLRSRVSCGADFDVFLRNNLVGRQLLRHSDSRGSGGWGTDGSRVSICWATMDMWIAVESKILALNWIILVCVSVAPSFVAISLLVMYKTASLVCESLTLEECPLLAFSQKQSSWKLSVVLSGPHHLWPFWDSESGTK